MAAASELILNPDGSVYHLQLLPGEVAETIITVGDPDRVESVSRHFDVIELKKKNREFVTHTGRIGNQRLSVISTGIGTDNIDIVFNELDALFNVDLGSGQEKDQLKQLTFVRIGTSGTLRTEIPVDSTLVSAAAIGLDGVLFFYKDYDPEVFRHLFKDIRLPAEPYFAPADEAILEKLGSGLTKGITVTANGFYASQNRQIRAEQAEPRLFELVKQVRYKNWEVTNFEMETAGIYGLARVLGHQAISFNAILANRATGQFSTNPKGAVDQLIIEVLGRLTRP
jgi:uridine phosphorylase